MITSIDHIILTSKDIEENFDEYKDKKDSV